MQLRFAQPQRHADPDRAAQPLFIPEDGGQNVIWQLTFQDGVLDSYVMLFR